MNSANHGTKPIVLITGSAGNIGTALAKRLSRHYTVVGMDQPGTGADFTIDLTDDASVQLAFERFRSAHRDTIAAVIHLAAYFDFSGEESPLYQAVNVEGTRHLLEALTAFSVERFIYSGTMLVHHPGEPGDIISENTAIEPGWAYPKSKAETETVIQEYSDRIPCARLHLAGLYDSESAVPTLTHQIARIYERDMKSHLYAGDIEAGQAFIHREDMLDLFVRVIERRRELPDDITLLAGEEQVLSYRELQHRIGELVHGEQWHTYTLPENLAKLGAWLEEKSEPAVPDAFDHGEKPFIKPFLIDLASDHYALDINRARDLLDWEPRHFIGDELTKLVNSLKDDPVGWYRNNGIRPPDWLQAGEEKTGDADALRQRHERRYREEHQRHLWAHWVNIGLGCWLLNGIFHLGTDATPMVVSDVLSGVAVIALSCLSLSWRLPAARWGTAAVGLWLLHAPLLFWSTSAAAYLNDTLVGALIMGLAVGTRPSPGVSPVAAQTGPTIPPGWDFSPSSWFQRLPIIILAVVGFIISHFLAAYQLGHIDAVWEPFFAGALPDAKNGTEEIITSHVSEAWPVPDAGAGAVVYLLEIITGLIGSSRRWRTMPWIVLLFGIMIVPLGAVSITFIIIQPIVLDTWCTLCLIAAAAMVLQIPYSLDELVATGSFMRRRMANGQPFLRVLFLGDTDDGRFIRGEGEDSFEQNPVSIVRDMFSGSVSLPWGLALCIAIGIALMFTRPLLGVEGAMADGHHLIGSLIITFSVAAMAEVTRSVRFVNLLFALALMVLPFILSSSLWVIVATLAAGAGVTLGSLPRGRIRCTYGEWDRVIV